MVAHEQLRRDPAKRPDDVDSGFASTARRTLSVGSASNLLEDEADRMAEAVVARLDPVRHQSDGRIRRMVEATVASPVNGGLIQRTQKRKNNSGGRKTPPKRRRFDSESESESEVEVEVPQPRAPSSRTRKTPAKVSGGFGDSDMAKFVASDPLGHGVLPDEVEQVEAELAERENRVDETTGTKQGGMSGVARSDKGDAELAAWLLDERPSNSAKMITDLINMWSPIRHSVVDRDDVITSARLPSQDQALSHLPDDARQHLAEIRALLEGGDRSKRLPELASQFRSAVSANVVLAHKKQEGDMDRRGFEILHMAGRAVGNPTLALPDSVMSELFGDSSMPTWTGKTNNSGESFTPPQNPANLAIGSFAANTLMMAIEGAVTKVSKDIVLTTRAFAPRGSQHLAIHIVMTITHKPSGAERNYYIHGVGQRAPVDVYRHLAADAEQFISGSMDASATDTTMGGETFYEYPTAAELIVERDKAVKDGETKAKSTKSGGTSSGLAGGPRTPLHTPEGVMHLNQTAGAGNCFFHSLFEAKTESRSTDADQQAMREAVLKAVTDNPQLAASYFVNANSPEYHEFAADLLLEGTYVDNQTPSAAADALGIEIVIHNPDGTIYFDAVPNAAIVGPPTETVHVYYDGGHYNSYTKAPL